MPVGHAEHVSELDCWKAAERCQQGTWCSCGCPRPDWSRCPAGTGCNPRWRRLPPRGIGQRRTACTAQPPGKRRMCPPHRGCRRHYPALQSASPPRTEHTHWPLPTGHRTLQHRARTGQHQRQRQSQPHTGHKPPVLPRTVRCLVRTQCRWPGCCLAALSQARIAWARSLRQHRRSQWGRGHS